MNVFYSYKKEKKGKKRKTARKGRESKKKKFRGYDSSHVQRTGGKRFHSEREKKKSSDRVNGIFLINERTDFKTI